MGPRCGVYFRLGESPFMKHLYQWGSPEKPTIICLHGMGGTGLGFGELAQQWLGDFHVAALDLPGCGGSDALSEEAEYLPTQMADRMAGAFETLGKDQVYVMGHSWGAHLSLYFAQAYPERIKGVILLDGGYLQNIEIAGSLEEELEGIEDFYESVRFPSWDEFIESEKSELQRWSEELEAASRAQMTEKDGEIRLVMEPATAKAAIKGIYMEQTAGIFSQISPPVLLLRATLPAEIEETRKQAVDHFMAQISQAEVHAIANTTHDIYRDAPVETAKVVKQWIRQKER